ncbi:MAG: universal stress protein [Syntrophobacterales bacterium]|jgi:nucleotide-binding universal stress UspA family protein
MVQINRILYPSDFSGCSFQVLPYVRSVAAKYGAEIYLLYVARNLHLYTSSRKQHSSSSTLVEKTLKELEMMLDKFCDKHLLDCPNFNRIVAVGDPGEEIVMTVKKKKIDLVVMGTHGRRGLEHTLFGTVAKYVVMHSRAPVLLVNPYRVKGEE